LPCARAFAGEHLELQQRSVALARQRDKRIAAADRFKKLQIKAIHELFEYEKQDAAAQYEVMCHCHVLIPRLHFGSKSSAVYILSCFSRIADRPGHAQGPALGGARPRSQQAAGNQERSF
jgi:hypothetical protein